MDWSKSAAVFTMAVPAAAMGSVTWVVSVSPTPLMEPPTLSIVEPTPLIFASVSLVVDALAASPSSLLSVSTISRSRASSLSLP